MPPKIRIIVSGLIVTVIAIIIYIIFRINIIEKDFIKVLNNRTAHINRIYRNFNEKYTDIKANKNKLKELFQLINKKYPEIALIAAADMDYTVELISKNNRILKSEKMYKTIVDDFLNRKLSVPSSKEYITRYYNLNGKNNDSQKFYIINKIINNNRLFYLFPYKPRKQILIKVTLEVSMIIIAIIIITTVIFIKSSQNSMPTEMQKNKLKGSHNLAENIGRDSYNIDLKGRSIQSSEKKLFPNEIRSASDSLNKQVYRLFSDLNSKYFPESISLYLKVTDNLLSKSFEYKGKSFIKIDSSSFDTIDIDNDAGKELLKSTVMILERGSKFIFPIIHENSLLGVISIIRDTGFNGKEIQDIKNDLIGILKQLSEYIVISRVMIDADTGLYSKAYFDLKYNEEIDSAVKNSEDLSIILLKPFKNNSTINMDQYSSIAKLVSSTLSNIIKNDHFVSMYEDFLAIIIPGLKSNYCLELAEKIFNTLCKIKIKIDNDNYTLLDPYIGISSTDSIIAGEDLFKAAKNNLGNSLKSDTGNIFS